MRKLILFFGSVAAIGWSQPQPGAVRRKGDGGPATKAEINGPSSIALDRSGNLYVYETDAGAVRRIDAVSQVITTVVEGCNPKKRHLTQCVGPISGLHVDLAGNLLFSEFTYNRLSSFDLRPRTLSVFAGNGDRQSSGDGGRATDAGISGPYCFAIDSRGNIVVCDSGNSIRPISSETGIITTVAGSGRRGFGGDHGAALSAEFAIPLSVAVDRSDNLYITDGASNRIRRVDHATGIIETIAGTGPPSTGSLYLAEFCCEGRICKQVPFYQPWFACVDRNGNLLFVTPGRICRIDKEGRLTTIAGVGREGFSGDGGPATSARIGPSRIAVDALGNLFLAEYANNRIRRVDAMSGVITTVGGNGLPDHPPRIIL